MADRKIPATVGECGTKCEIRVLEERIKKNGEVEVIVKGEAKSSDLDSQKRYALVTTKAFDKDNKLTKTILKVNSYLLLNVLREVVGFYPTIATGFEVPFEMEAPFGMLYHYWEEFEARLASESDDSTRMHVKLLLEYMTEELGPAKLQNESMVRRGYVNYDFAWTIFKPGELLFKNDYGHARLYLLQKTFYGESNSMGKYMAVQCIYVDYDGDNFGQAEETFYLRENEYFGVGTAARITRLEIYPRTFVEAGKELEEKLRFRGLQFFKHKSVEVVRYDGMCEYLKLPPSSWFHWQRGNYGLWLPQEETGRMILDRKTFAEDCQDDQVAVIPVEGSVEGIRYTALNESGKLNPILCPSFVYGFSLQRKRWSKFFIDCISPVAWKTAPMEALILQPRQKAVLTALTTSHEFPKKAREASEQKGKGLVILLHGTPGSGKTLTADSAAEATHRGLLSITMGELNIDGAGAFELKISQLLRLATHWGVIVLIDEADVFLEHRKSGPGANTETNSLVAVFLRHLEYFSGIIFLTSNRVDVFDAAVTSRVHLALQYTPPSANTRLELWSQRLNAMSPDELEIDLDEVLSSVRQVEMNGREISNTLNTAMTLARHEGSRLQLQHVETVVGLWKDFQENIAKIADEQKTMPRQDSMVAPPSAKLER